MTVRLTLAAAAGAFAPEGSVLLIGAAADLDLSVFGTAAVTVVQDRMPDAAAWAARGVTTVPAVPEGSFDVAVVFLPRAKVQARDQIARAAQVSGRVIVDGQKTDGIEAVLKDLRKRADVEGPISKAHGKLFWVTGATCDDWIAPDAVLDGRWHVAPGVFSADHVDPGSALLAQSLPEGLHGRVADLGAGWGYLSGVALERCADITELHLVEAQGAALECARQNVTDPRAVFHWADVTEWSPDVGFDAVIMNPPFHSGRNTDLDLGHAFVKTAARILRKGGRLWMVANRHLAYEQVLRAHFVSGDTFHGDTKYKLFEARK